jgi:carboxyl-terminal processing protease
MFLPFRPEKLQGVWRCRGYGFLLSVRGEIIRLCHETRGFCWEDTRADIREYIAYYEPISTQVVRFATLPDESYYTFDRIPELPRVLLEPEKTDRAINLRAFSQTMETHYAFFKERNVRWDEKAKQAIKEISGVKDDEGLFVLLSSMIEGIADPHTSLVGLGKRVSPGKGKSVTARNLNRAFEKHLTPEPYDTLAGFNTAWRTKERGAGRRLCLAGKPSGEYASGLLQWGFLREDVGYIEIGAMTEFVGETPEAENKNLQTELQKIFQQFSSTKALIVDISQNLGGEDRIARAVADCFADKERFAYNKVAFVKGKPVGQIPQKFYIKPAKGGIYTKPVYLLTSDVTVSAAEILVLCLRAVPQVIHIGQTTRGALSDTLPKQLPNGWTFSLSNEVYLDAKGICYEAKGIPPTKPLALYPADNLWEGHTLALKKLLASL